VSIYANIRLCYFKGDCRVEMKVYLQCLKENKQSSLGCRELSENYLQCRMKNDLMKPDDLKNLGFPDRER
jgi:cytochrome c oxidase assembly protein subunit 19